MSNSFPNRIQRLIHEALEDFKSKLEDLGGDFDLENYATKEELTSKADKSELDNLATKAELNNKANTSDLATKADKSELTPLATKDYVDAQIEALRQELETPKEGE